MKKTAIMEEILEKKCNHCLLVLDVSNFRREKNLSVYGFKKYYSYCKGCEKAKYKKLRAEKPELFSLWRKKQTIKEINKEKSSVYNKKYREKNREKIKEYKKQKRKEDKNKISDLLRSRLKKVLKCVGVRKTIKTLDLLGCTIDEFKTYMESKFTDGMTWENRGFYGWHIDHIKPCSAFDLTDSGQQKICFHYTNLQPLWCLDNLRKGDRYMEN